MCKSELSVIEMHFHPHPLCHPPFCNLLQKSLVISILHHPHSLSPMNTCGRVSMTPLTCPGRLSSIRRGDCHGGFQFLKILSRLPQICPTAYWKSHKGNDLTIQRYALGKLECSYSNVLGIPCPLFPTAEYYNAKILGQTMTSTSKGQLSVDTASYLKDLKF